MCCIMKVTKQTFATFKRKKMSLANTIQYSSFIYNQLKNLIYANHIPIE